MTDKLNVKAGLRSRRIDVDYLARVEGEGALRIDVVDGDVRDVKLQIFEPPRFFEALLVGRRYSEAPDITSRICGICPVAYMMSAVHAIESAYGVEIDEGLRRLRRMLYCGEWIESHVLHIYLLHAPDFLGFDDVMGMAEQDAEAVQRGLRMKKAGNNLIRILGGREIHPINVKTGGFYRKPDQAALADLLDELRWARDAAEETVRWTTGFDFPELERDYEFVSVSHDTDYPMNEGRIVSSAGLDISADRFEDEFEEQHVEHSNALQGVRRKTGTPYFVGPLARFNLNRDKLTPATRALAADTGFDRVIRNPFESIVVRALEVFFAFDEAIALIEDYVEPKAASVELPIAAGTGTAATEAPRGLLYHRYKIDDEGMIVAANIVPPTSQNQRTIEADLNDLVAANLSLSTKDLTWRCEQAIRNYDPCISCATHFLRLDINNLDSVES